MTIDNATLGELLESVEPSNPQSMFTDAVLFGQLKKTLAQRMLQAELAHHGAATQWSGAEAQSPQRQQQEVDAGRRNET